MILIPTAPNQQVHQECINSILEQTCPWRYFRIAGGLPNENFTKQEKIYNIVISRNLCLENMMNENFVLMLDSDCILLSKNSVAKMVTFLRYNDNHIAVALRHEDYPQRGEVEPNHIQCGAWMMRGKIFSELKLKFHFENTSCECVNMCRDIRAAGWRIGYLDEATMIKDMHDA
jgi:hypothetical protein